MSEPSTHDWRKLLIPPACSVREAIAVIDRGALQIALVVDAGERLLGTVTDGDIRRGFLRGLGLETPVDQVMNPHPVSAALSASRPAVLTLMRERSIRQCPLVSADGRVQGLCFMDDFLREPHYENLVVLMAGGLGSRLAPLTDECPKPLLKVGGKPILEIILQNFIEQGFSRFYVSINYKADMIREHIGDGSRWGATVHYLTEQQRLGTAGALSLLPERPADPLLVMNADLLTKINMPQFLQFHRGHPSTATMAVREYDFQVPYGVVESENLTIKGIVEKPVHRFFVNAGVYCLNPEALEVIPPNTYFDMTSLFQKLNQTGRQTFCYPIREYWLDIGQVTDFHRANREYGDALS